METEVQLEAPPPGRAVAEPTKAQRTQNLWLLKVAIEVVHVGPALILLLAIVVMAVLSPVFLSLSNVQNLGIQAAIIGVVATGQLLVILTAGVDLSVGSIVGLSAVVGVEASIHGASPVLVILSMLGTGLAVGLLNATLLVGAKSASPLVVTLATLGIARGLALMVSDGKSEFGFPDIVDTLGTGLVGPIPVAVIVTVVTAGVVAVFLQLTQWGRWIFAVGADREAAKRAGIPTGKILVTVYVLCGLLAGLCSILVVGQSSVAQPTAGNLLELDAITAVIIGGASFFGGRGSVLNVLVGCLILAVIRNGLNLLSVDPFLQQVSIGVLILVAIQLDQARGRLESRFRTTQALKEA